ncbi:uncharacterized protein ColSpa_01196 [Colletotrichum spaethianum]|uniref:Uncharacterized protein n=1 Tax=Colletotrichum spaethianum TaxID=700344 RepID=A0AA37NW68_9PEZI|nr:uncharacterized protein ColSpa_01196 [Colletotrichum spaethianum]GKT41015.1 hypothetical protein ColSpa_01196 [Colletotrichum spaethianum]
MAQTLGQFSVIWGGIGFLTATTVVGSIPLIVGAPLFEAPAAARMVIKCACDLILILDQAFQEGGKSVSREKIERTTAMYTKSNVPGIEDDTQVMKSRRRLVHQEINKLIPLVSTIAMEALRKKSATVALSAYRHKSVSEYRDGIREILAKHRIPPPESTELDNSDVASVGSDTLYSGSVFFDIPEDKEEMNQFLGGAGEDIAELNRVDVRV